MIYIFMRGKVISDISMQNNKAYLICLKIIYIIEDNTSDNCKNVLLEIDL